MSAYLIMVTWFVINMGGQRRGIEDTQKWTIFGSE